VLSSTRVRLECSTNAQPQDVSRLVKIRQQVKNAIFQQLPDVCVQVASCYLAEDVHRSVRLAVSITVEQSARYVDLLLCCVIDSLFKRRIDTQRTTNSPRYQYTGVCS